MVVKLVNLTTGQTVYVNLSREEWDKLRASCGADPNQTDLWAWHAKSERDFALELWDRVDVGPRISRSIFYIGKGGTQA